MTFEESLEKLNQIRDELSSSDITLDKSIKLYEESVEYTKTCFEMLKSTEGKIAVVKGEIDKLVEEPLNGFEE